MRRIVLTLYLLIGNLAAAAEVDSIGLTVSDLDRSIEFYTKVLAFEKVSEFEADGEDYEHLNGVFGLRIRRARLKLGDEAIELTEYLAPRGRAVPADSRSNDGWFQHIAIVVGDMNEAYRLLRRHKVSHASSGPQRLPDWNSKAGGIQAFYFHDPDGHTLEVLSFPKGKGLDKWHQPDGRLFLGIDHTAIVISDTDVSLRFYRDRLGFKVAGESENYGIEQERLNNVFGARLRITALRGDRGPGVEFLEYLAPRDGRPFPRDAKANDLIHWQTRVRVDSVADSAARLAGAKSVFVSPGVVRLAGAGDFVMVRDPDGHSVELASR